MSRPEGERLSHRVAGVFLAAALVPLLSACTTDPAPAAGPKWLTGPIERSNQQARIEGRAPAPQPAILSYCYSNLINTPEQLELEAGETCARLGGRLAFYGEDSVLTPCPLLQPVRATYLCHPIEN